MTRSNEHGQQRTDPAGRAHGEVVGDALDLIGLQSQRGGDLGGVELEAERRIELIDNALHRRRRGSNELRGLFEQLLREHHRQAHYDQDDGRADDRCRSGAAHPTSEEPADGWFRGDGREPGEQDQEQEMLHDADHPGGDDPDGYDHENPDRDRLDVPLVQRDPDGPEVRCGRYRITRRVDPPRLVHVRGWLLRSPSPHMSVHDSTQVSASPRPLPGCCRARVSRGSSLCRTSAPVRYPRA